jgi:hypothetical protein
MQIQLFGGPSDGLTIDIPVITSHITIPIVDVLSMPDMDEPPEAHYYVRSPRPGYFDYVGVK